MSLAGCTGSACIVVAWSSLSRGEGAVVLARAIPSWEIDVLLSKVGSKILQSKLSKNKGIVILFCLPVVPTALYLGIWSVSTMLQRPLSLFSSYVCLVRLLFTAEEHIFTLVSFAPLQVSRLLSHSLILVSFAPLQSP